MIRHRPELLLLATLLASGLFFLTQRWHASAAGHPMPVADRAESAATSAPSMIGQRATDRRAPAPPIDPYVRPEFAAEMRALQPAIAAAAHRHNRPEISHMSDYDFAVVIAQIMYNEHFGWFEERVTPAQALTPVYEDLQRETNAAGLSNLSVWPANLRPSVAIEILRQQLPLPRSTNWMTVPVQVTGSQIDPQSYRSQRALYAAVTAEISQPNLAVEYLAANLERGLYRAQVEGVPVTWRTLAAWHNQGIVSPRDIRENATASDYLRRCSAYLGKARALIDQPYITPAVRRLAGR
ncbi:MAG TPA: hypothetical protein VKE41_14720 [Roseiflexaceae bacterium]|nr:hypothetical protein [Roseiflexaceae bacterium]